jgi:lipid-binding SYLF domain-containing protein
MRTGLWVSGAGGSGVLIARTEDGSWSAPSGILVHTLGVGFMAGIDIYDCVLVINNRAALAAFSKLRVSLGGEVSVVAGPLGAGGILESELLKNRKPVFSYMKSRGLYGGIQLDGTFIVERNDENARFYNERIGVNDILAGKIRHVPSGTRLLMEVVKEAEGRADVDASVMQEVHAQPAPGDFEVEKMSEPSLHQQEAYGPPQGWYAPVASGGLDPDFDSKHPLHPGPPQETYQPPPPLYDTGSGQGAYQHPPEKSTRMGQDEYYPPPPGPPPTSGNAHGHPPPQPPRPQAAETPYYPPPPTGPPPR